MKPFGFSFSTFFQIEFRTQYFCFPIVAMNVKIITKNLAADSKIGSPKMDFRAVGTHESHPTAWEFRSHYLRFHIQTA